MINILYSGNDKVFDGMLTCSLSILKRSRNDEPITFEQMVPDKLNYEDSAWLECINQVAQASLLIAFVSLNHSWEFIRDHLLQNSIE